MNKSLKKGEERLKAGARKISVVEGSAYSVMDGFGLRYITPYAIAIGMSNFLIGLLSSVPGLLGSMSQLPSSKLVEKSSRKKIVMASVALQALMWLPLIAVGAAYFFFGLSSLYASILLLIFYTLLIVFGAFAGPAWNSWMRDLITKNTDSYFARRNTIAGTVGLLSAFIAGVLLSWFHGRGTFYGFLVIFLIAFLGRITCVYLFKRQYEPKKKNSEKYYFSFMQFLMKARYNNFGMFVIFSTLISFAVAIASPFFAVYMLKEMNFSYISYTIIITTPIIATLVSLPFWGKFGDKYGNIKILKICGPFIFTIPLLWMLSYFLIADLKILIVYLIAVEILSGVVWAGFNLSTGMFVFHAVTREKLPLCVAYNTILNSFGAFLGAVLGGAVSSVDFVFLGLTPLLTVFLVSTVFRFVFFFAFINKIKEVRRVRRFDVLKFGQFIPRILHNSLSENTGVRRTGHVPFR